MSSACLRCMLTTTALLSCAMAPCIASASGFGGTRADLGEPLQIPIADPDGHPWTLQGRLCRPVGVRRPRVVVIAHGSPAKASDRPGMTLETCDGESARWFLRRHYAVALVLRLGYGATGGPWSEGYDGCDRADYVKAGLETARQLKRIVDVLTALPDYSPTGAVVVGQSAGGWGTLAYETLPHPNVGAFVNMAGGRGGHFHDRPNSNCHPDRLIAAATTFGQQATTPMLWIYTANDSFFGPELAASLHRAFTEAGGHAVLVTPAAFGDDGHHLFFGHGGSTIWGPAVERYLGSVEAPASP
ncbi:hypothetical protein NG827_12655 [Xanthomonas sacchari]|uniref:hypothetical protein n=1 Tax=Xanthomonas sacchari TaxID=56458 RepID=UPI00224E6ACB|nr:hypothetical protein [Xanthomonas sacchari]UYK83327.1 hypothetical protein NG827_12655 [Xanthomonas sacchari]